MFRGSESAPFLRRRNVSFTEISEATVRIHEEYEEEMPPGENKIYLFMRNYMAWLIHILYVIPLVALKWVIVDLTRTEDPGLIIKNALSYHMPFLLLVSMLFLWGCNLRAFHFYTLVFGTAFAADKHPCTLANVAMGYASVTLFFTIICCEGYIGFVCHGYTALAAILPLLLYFMIASGVLLCCNSISRSSLVFLLKTLFRVLIPIKPVLPSDILLADMLTSMSKVIGDIASSICRSYGILAGHTKCGAHSPLVPAMMSLPFALRTFQLMKQYRDTRAVVHIYNVIKQLTSIAVIVLSSLKHHVDQKTWRDIILPIWIAVGIFNSLFTFGWDVIIDWDLRLEAWCFRLERPNRDSAIFSSFAWGYYFLVVVELILRSTWTIKLSPHLYDQYLLITLSAFLEIIRRFIWIHFRMENLHFEKHPKNPSSGTSPATQGANTLGTNTQETIITDTQERTPTSQGANTQGTNTQGTIITDTQGPTPTSQGANTQGTNTQETTPTSQGPIITNTQNPTPTTQGPIITTTQEEATEHKKEPLTQEDAANHEREASTKEEATEHKQKPLTQEDAAKH